MLTWWEPTTNARIHTLSALVAVDLSSNLLVTIPMSIAQLTGLTELYLNDNKIFWLPTELGALCSLEVLRLNDNSLSELPASIGKLKNLKMLHAARNMLKKLPPTIGQLSKLEELGVSRNLLTELPHEIGSLRSLKHMILTDNRLASIPASIGRLGRLTKLNFNGNKLKQLPTSIGGLHKLREIFLERNYLIDPPQQIVHVPDWKRASVIVEYFKSRHYSLHWSRNNHALFGPTCNAVLFTAVAASNRVITLHTASDSWVRLLPPELWDVVFRFLTGSSFIGTYMVDAAVKHHGNPVGLAAQNIVSRLNTPSPTKPNNGVAASKSPWMKNHSWM
jgi:hypothetical protein